MSATATRLLYRTISTAGSPTSQPVDLGTLSVITSVWEVAMGWRMSSSAAPSGSVPLANAGAGAVGVSSQFARGDHQHPASGGGATLLGRLVGLDGVGAATAQDLKMFATNPTAFIGPMLIRGNAAQVGDAISFRVGGTYYHGEVGSMNPIFVAIVGTHGLGASSLLVPPGSYTFSLEASYTIVAIGATGKLIGSHSLVFTNVSTGAVLSEGGIESTGFHSYDFTADLHVDVEFYAGGGTTPQITAYFIDIQHLPNA